MSARTLGIGDGPVQRNLRDYILILRERIWYVVIVFFLGGLPGQPGLHPEQHRSSTTASATIEVLARDPVVMKVQEVRDADLRGPEDFNTQIKILESGSIVQMVASRLSPEDIKALVAPYEGGDGGDSPMPEDILAKNRKVIPMRMTPNPLAGRVHALRIPRSLPRWQTCSSRSS